MNRIRILALAFAFGLTACDQAPSVALLPTCQPSVQVAPANPSIRVGQSVDIALTLDSRCPPALVRNETPGVLQVDVLSTTSVRATGRSVGNGVVRVLSPADTLVTATAFVTVTP
jgi:hypothetical protein